LFQVMGVFAEFERAMIQERVRAGLRRAVSDRKALAAPGRPGVREIAKRFGVAPNTVMRINRLFASAA
jgi:DNA invertase Pin-like site-specific DNA recombinase